jgi:hypothetical protein
MFNEGVVPWDSAHHDYRYSNDAPNGSLMHRNAMFNSIARDQEVFLAHVTYSLETIVNNRMLHPSAGCLVGSVYCTPVTAYQGKLRLHNLGAYYYLHEAKMANPQATADPDILLIRARKKDPNRFSLEGVNYLRLGMVHYSTYKNNQHAADSFTENSGIKKNSICRSAVRELLLRHSQFTQLSCTKCRKGNRLPK